MSTSALLYWFNAIGTLSNVVFGLLITTTIIAALMTFIGFIAFINKCDDDDWPRFFLCYRRALVVTAILSVAVVFIPSTKDLYVMYGVGNTIDYLKSNETAKELPDKAIKVLDRWLDSENKDNDKK